MRPALDHLVRALVSARFVIRSIRTWVADETRRDRVVLTELIESGKFTPVVDRSYGLSEAPEAIRYVSLLREWTFNNTQAKSAYADPPQARGQVCTTRPFREPHPTTRPAYTTTTPRNRSNRGSAAQDRLAVGDPARSMSGLGGRREDATSHRLPPGRQLPLSSWGLGLRGGGGACAGLAAVGPITGSLSVGGAREALLRVRM